MKRVINFWHHRHAKSFQILGAVLLVVTWFALADFVLADKHVVLDPILAVLSIKDQALTSDFWFAILGTLQTCVVSFTLAFTLALVFAISAHRFHNLRYLLTPFVTVFRTAPTIAVILILLLTLPWSAVTFFVAFLVTFPLLFSNLLTAVEAVPCEEIDAGKSLGLHFLKRVLYVYLPNMLHTLLTNARSSFGLNIKVVIAAEVLGVPNLSIGFQIQHYKQMLDYETAFTYLCVAIILAWICDTILLHVSKF